GRRYVLAPGNVPAAVGKFNNCLHDLSSYSDVPSSSSFSSPSSSSSSSSSFSTSLLLYFSTSLLLYFSTSKLDVGRWTLDVRRWTFDVRRWTFDVRRSTFDDRDHRESHKSHHSIRQSPDGKRLRSLKWMLLNWMQMRAKGAESVQQHQQHFHPVLPN
ncbi:MAG: hypothetical protein ACI9HK_002694, partial [Pirellulaceae bacterium]